MHLFRKSNKKDNDSALQQNTESGTVTASGAEGMADRKEAGQERQMSRVEMERQIREEAKRLRVTEHLLSVPHLQRVMDTLRLNETKLANVEENLMRTREQKERLRRFKELQGEMETQRAHLFEINKQAAGLLGEKKELDRFETFENIQGHFQRLLILERQRRDEKARESALAGELDRLQHELGDEQKRLLQCTDEARESEEHLKQGQGAIGNSLRLEGSNTAYSYIRQRAREHGEQLQSRCRALEKALQEQDHAIEALEREMERKQTRLQSTDSYSQMVGHSELIVAQLGKLHELQEKRASAEAQMKESERRQRTENEMLGRIFADYQQIEAQIKTVSDELVVHRKNILGQDSYQLQERAMRLKRRRQMLKSAQSLWRRIQTVYGLIEEKQQEINSLRLHMEHTAENVRKMETGLGMLRRSAQEKEYTFTLSKSQNVIQLRSDLKEGVSCTVCGATHHPYHSDTMLEQNKLIGEMKTEAELLRAEQRNREKELLEAQLDLERTTTARKRAEDELITLRALQNEAVKDWDMYAELDNSFRSCDSTTNAEARTAMLRQLIENIETDVRKAQDELDTYNFHQGRINELTEVMARHEQVRGELTTRMNELNTSCQVLAREVEWISAKRQEMTHSYGELFEALDKNIAFPDWQNTWKKSHEGMIMRIQELTKERRELTEGIRQQEEQLAQMTAARSQNRMCLTELMQYLQGTIDAVNDCDKRMEENGKELESLLGGQSPDQFSQTLVGQYLENRKKMEGQQQLTDSRKKEFLLTQGRAEDLKETAAKTDAMAAEERSMLDVWIRQYNASHSPVQYAELAQFFEQDKDWTRVRELIRSTDMEARLTQAKVDQLRSQMVSIQAEGNIPDGDATEALLALAKQEEVLEKRRMDAMLLIATHKLTLQAHEKAEALIRGEKMQESSAQSGGI